jgi:DNA-binding MarR family transcriptional regulator
MVARTRKQAAQDTPAEVIEDVPENNGDVKLGFLGDYIGFHLRLAQDASYRTFSRSADKDLMKPGRFPALAIIHLNPGISQSALGRAIARDKSTVSPLIKDLQKSGFIARKASVLDRRSVTLSLTKKGERTLDKLLVRANEHEQELDRIAGASKGRLITLLDKITDGMA